jgi:chromate transporter
LNLPAVEGRSYGELARIFSLLALRGFGGVAAQARDVLVEREHWLGDTEFAELLGIGQIVPGANVTNLTAVVGYAARGIPGAIVALAALTLPSLAIAIVLLTLALQLDRFPAAIAAERAVLCGAAGITIASGLRTLRSLAKVPAARVRVVLVAALAAVLVVFGVPLLIVAAVGVGLSFFLAWRRA